VFTSIGVSNDNRTVVLSAFGLPPSTEVTVAVGNSVEDLSGNPANDFTSQFTTGPLDTSRPQVLSQRPSNGATDIALNSHIVLYTTEAIDPTTINGALFVSQNLRLSPEAAAP
jgi:hypothetical protein